MTHCNTVLSQMLNMITGNAFEMFANTIDDNVRSSALSPRSQFAVKLPVSQMDANAYLILKAVYLRNKIFISI
jgi:hypothetical protein